MILNGKRFPAMIAAVLLTGTVLTGCKGNSSEGLWVNIEPTESAEFGEPKYPDGTYLTQEVKEPAPDPYADDTEKLSDGVTEDGIRYAVYARHAEITGHTDTFELTELTVPKELEGKPVSRIASVPVSDEIRFEVNESGAFFGCYSLNTVSLPDTLTEIGDYAFYGCKNLREINIPESVTVIGTRAFSMCRNLQILTVPTGIGRIGDSAFAQTPWYDSLLFHRDFIIFNGILYDAGQRCPDHVRIPDYVVRIADYAFYNCNDIKSVTVPASVQKIGKCAFCACASLSTLLIENPDCEICSEASTVTNRFADEQYIFNGTIRAEAGSTAEAFANQFGWRFSSDTSAVQPEQPAETTEPVTETGTDTEQTTGIES